MTREEVLAELKFLATVEHALVVEYITVCCALGHDLEADDGGPLTDDAKTAAAAASDLARDQMFRLRNLNLGLMDAARDPQLDRAASISSASHPAISLDPPSAAQLERLLDREEAITAAVDERYARLDAALSPDDGLRPLVEEGQTHASKLVSLHALGDPLAAGILRATRREPHDSLEERLLAVSNAIYHLVVALLRDRFMPDANADRAMAAMFALDDANRALVQRGLLPPFTPA